MSTKLEVALVNGDLLYPETQQIDPKTLATNVADQMTKEIVVAQFRVDGQDYVVPVKSVLYLRYYEG